MRKIVGAVVGILALGAGLAVFAVARLDADALGRLVVDRVNRQSGIELKAERFRLGPLSGLELGAATLHAELDSGILDAEVERLILEHELWPLLRRRVVVRRLHVESPRLMLVSKSSGGSGAGDARSATDLEPGGAEALGAAGLDIDIALARIENGHLTMSSDDPTADTVRLEGLDVVLRELRVDPAGPSSWLRGLSTRGEIQAERIAAGEMVLEDASGEIAIAGGELRLTGVDLHALNSSIHVEAMTADLGQEPYPYELNMEGDIDIDGVLGGNGSEFGPGSLSLAAAGLGPDLADLDGQGLLRLDAGRLPAVDMVTQIDALLGRPLLTGTAYEAAEVPFRLDDGALLLDRFALTGEVLSVLGEGRADLAGPISLALDVLVPRADIDVEELPGELVDALTDPDGRTTVYFDVAGTFTEPRVAIDMDRIQGAARNAARRRVEGELGKETEKLKDKLLDKLGEGLERLRN